MAYGRSIRMHGAGAASGGTVESAMSSLGMPTASEYAQLMACCTSSSGMTFHARTAVAFALCAPSICSMPALAMMCLATAASTKLRYMLMLR
jgi:hypothetical protein